MRKHIQKLSVALDKIKKMRKVQIILLGFIAILLILLVGLSKDDESSVNLTNEEPIREVEIANVAELSLDRAPLLVVGTVNSKAEAQVRTEAQGQIISIQKSAGSYASKGEVVATIENSTQRAQLAQAQAALESAKAQVGQSQNLSQVSLANAQKVLNETIVSTENTVNSVFTTIDDVVRGKVDTLFTNGSSSPKLIFNPPTNQGLKFLLEDERYDIEQDIRDFVETQKQDDLVAKLNNAENLILKINDFLDDLAEATNGLSTINTQYDAVTITTWQGIVSASRNLINGASASIVGTRGALRGAETALRVAQENFDQSDTSAVTTASTQLAQAQAMLESAQISLNKTIIRSPISGIITNLPVREGDYVSIFQEIFTVSNTGALEVVAYLTDQDSRDLMVGNDVLVNNKIESKITSISPTIDPLTKKREIKVTLDKNGDFVDGQTADLSISRNGGGVVVPDNLFVPLSSLKALSTGIVVFSVDNKGNVLEMPVEIGPLSGEKVLVLEGLNASDEIIKDVRGIKSGDKVNVVNR